MNDEKSAPTKIGNQQSAMTIMYKSLTKCKVGIAHPTQRKGVR